jgi:hypothetical protein
MEVMAVLAARFPGSGRIGDRLRQEHRFVERAEPHCPYNG